MSMVHKCLQSGNKFPHHVALCYAFIDIEHMKWDWPQREGEEWENLKWRGAIQKLVHNQTSSFGSGLLNWFLQTHFPKLKWWKSDNTKGKYLSVHLVTKIINRIMFPKTKELKMVWGSYQCKKKIPTGLFGHKNNSQFNFWKPGKKMKMTMQIIYWLVHLVTKATLYASNHEKCIFIGPLGAKNKYKHFLCFHEQKTSKVLRKPIW